MSTIGRINAIFGADTSGLKKGVDESVNYFKKLSDQIAESTKELDKFNDVLEAQANVAKAALDKMKVEQKIKIDADFAAIEEGAQEVDDFAETVEKTAPVVRVSADTSTARKEIEEISSEKPAEVKLGVDASGVGEGASRASAFLREFSATATDAFRATGDEALGGAKRFDTLRTSASQVAGAVTGAYQVIQQTAATTSAAITSIGVAASTVGRVGQEGFAGLERSVDGLVVSVGRSVQAVAQLRSVSGAIGEAVGAASSGFRTFTKTIGGYDTILRAVRGSEAAAATVMGSLGASFASAGASIATYSAIVAAARVASSGLSDEAKRYVDVAAQAAASFASLRVGLAAGSASYRVLAAAIYNSTSATEAAQKLFNILGVSMSEAASKATPLVARITQISAAIKLIAAASNEKTTAAGFAGLTAKVLVTSVAFRAATSAASAYVAGTSVMAATTAGATAALGGFLAAFPPTIALSAAAAVATGKFAHELERLSVAAQQVDQLADRFGASTQEMERLKMAAEFSRVSLSQLGKAQQTFFTNLSKVKVGQLNVENVREAKLAFDKLRISMEDLKGKDPREVFAAVGKKLAEIKDPAERTAIAFDLFGKQGAAIMPALKEFSELEEDFKRIGGALSSIDFDRFKTLETSFDRLHAASQTLGRTLLVPFTELQKAFNNMSAEIRGGMSSALAPLASMIADITKPVAVLIGMFGRVVGVMLRLVGVFTAIAAYFQIFATIAKLAEGIAAGFNSAMKPIEAMIDLFSGMSEQTGVLSKAFEYAMAVVSGLGSAIGYVIGLVAGGAAAILVGAAAWGVYTAAVALASATSLKAAVVFAASWIAAMGPLAIVGAGLFVVGAAVVGVAVAAAKGAKLLYSFGQSIGLIGKDREKIDATKASVDELSVALQKSGQAAQAAMMPGFDVKVPSLDEIKASIGDARGEMEGLTIEAAKFGDAGSQVASAAITEFNKLQQMLADGKISLDDFNKMAAENAKNLRKNLDAMRNDSPEITLKKNLELYKQLDDAVKQAGKSIRDLSATRVVNNKLFPASEEIQAAAKQYEDAYIQAVEAIKKKQASGGFQRELDQKKSQLEADKTSGKITTEEYNKQKLRLDSTSAQEEARKAFEEAEREFSQGIDINIKADMSFADDIRKRLEDAFLSPVDKFQKELEKIRNNKSLTDDEKALAEKDLRKTNKESLVGKTASEKYNERTRDLNQAKGANLINEGELNRELKNAADELASALGIPVEPSRDLEAASEKLRDAFGQNTISAEQFSKGMEAAREKFLNSLGIDGKTQSEKDTEQLQNLSKERAAKTISEDEYNRGREKIANDIVGQSAGSRIKEQRDRIDNAVELGGVSEARGAAATRKLDADRRSAAGLDNSPAQQLELGIDKVNDAFDVTGKSLDEIKASLSPQEFKEYQDALRKNRDGVLQSIGVDKSAVQAREEATQKLAGLALTAGEAAQASRAISDSFMSALGVTKTPFEQFSGELDNIAKQFGMAGQPLDKVRESLKGNAKDLELFDRAVKQSRDSMLASLGIEKSPQEAYEETLKKIDEAANSTDPNKKISKEQADQARINATRKRDEALGADTANNRASAAAEQRRKIEEAYGKNGEKNREAFDAAMSNLKKSMPGADAENPVEKFKKSMKELEYLKGSGALGKGKEAEQEFASRKLNLQAQLEEDLKGKVPGVDRRGIEGADARSKQGVDTYFRILRGNDKPGLKAQLDTAKNTKMIAEAMRDKNAAPVVVQLSR